MMEFWGVEVRAGQPLVVDPKAEYCVHISQAALGELKKDKAIQPVCLYLKHGDKKLVLGTLSHDKFPQISFDLVLEKPFELSHNCKDGSVYFTGYRVHNPDDGSEDEESEYESEEEQLPQPQTTDNGKPEANETKPADAKKPDTAAAKQRVNFVEPNKDVKAEPEQSDDSDDDDDESDEDEEDESSDDQVPQGLAVNGEDEDDDEDEEETDDEDTTPKKEAGPSQKRSVDSATKTPVPTKKVKVNTPQKTDGKKVSGNTHIATPHPAKGKEAKQQAQKSGGGSFSCNSCKRSFTTQMGLESHNKAKHSAGA